MYAQEKYKEVEAGLRIENYKKQAQKTEKSLEPATLAWK